MKTLSLVLLISMAVFACDCPCPEGNNEEKVNSTLLFGHRGSGGGVVNGLLENTLPSVTEALKYADGTEVDVQMSQSNTIWLYHNDAYTDLCPESAELLEKEGYNCILNSPDDFIRKLRFCKNGVTDRIYTLEELFERLSTYDNKMASIDIKGYFNSKCVEYNNVSEKYQEDLATELYRLVKKYDLDERVIAETNYLKTHEKLKELDPNFICHYMSYNNHSKGIEKAIALNLDGITMNIHDSSLNLENFNKAKSENLSIQMWTIHSKEDAMNALKYAPYSIQVGNINLLKELSNSNNGSQGEKSQLFH